MATHGELVSTHICQRNQGSKICYSQLLASVILPLGSTVNKDKVQKHRTHNNNAKQQKVRQLNTD